MLKVNEKIGMLINNEEIQSNQSYSIKDPGRFQETVATVCSGTIENVNQAVEAAHQAFLEWASISIGERIQKVQESCFELEETIPELAPLLVRENGSLLTEAQIDIGAGAGAIQNFKPIAEPYLKAQLFEDKFGVVEINKVPRGVVAAIIPWNLPIALTMIKLIPALISGNTLVIKPSPYAPLTLTLALRKVAAILPPGVINVINGDGEIGHALTTHPLVRKISFTGGTNTAGKVMAAASSTIKNLTLELGGNDPAIILDDVSMHEIMPELLKGIFFRSGQLCFAIKRIYVPVTLYNRFYDVFSQAVDEIKVGHGLDERSTMGPVINDIQYSHLTKLINELKQSNATVRELGKKVDATEWRSGYYILPTVIRDIDHSSEIVQKEQFGPVIPIIPYTSINQAIEMANDSPYGLGSSIWTTDLRRGTQLARQIQAGFTFINGHSIEKIHPRMPFGGIKQSGIGREFTELGLSEYVETHAIKIK